MIKKSLLIFLLSISLIFSSPVYSKEDLTKSLDRYVNKISKKFSRTYCNTKQFGISEEGSLAFAIGETNKEFRKNSLNKFIDYSLLRNSILNNLEKNCLVYDFPVEILDELRFN